MVFWETLRFDTPIPNSFPMTFTKDVSLNGIKIDKNQAFITHYRGCHYDKKQWKEVDQFVPERFDPLNKEWYLTPDGKKRHPYAFMPFHAGHRICMGKTFAELVVKFTIPILLYNYTFEPEENLHDFKPSLNIMKTPELLFTVKKNH